MGKSRLFAAYCFIVVCFFILIVRYGYLSLIDYNNLFRLSVDNYSMNIVTLPSRGAIIDRNGVVLADNKVSFVAAILLHDLKTLSKSHKAQLFNNLGKYIVIDSLDKHKFNVQQKNAKNYDWIIIKDDLSDNQIAMLTAHNSLFPEVKVFSRIKRVYPFNDVYDYSLGYVGRLGEVDKSFISKHHMENSYLSSDYIGKTGIERYYESVLRGTIGRKIIKTDANGHQIGEIANLPAIDGDMVQLTIDHKLQTMAYNLLGDRRGAIVILNPNTGGVLAFVSKPGFNPNWFVDGVSLDDWDDLIHDKNKPLLNRASVGTYPPGSTFKPFMAIAALFWGVRNYNSTIYDPGYFTIPGSKHKFHDSDRLGRGEINFLQAIEFSSDTFFYKLGLDLGIQKADYILEQFGFGSKTGIDLPYENAGLLPSENAKALSVKRRHGNPSSAKWQSADSVITAIGQGMNSYTPLQMAFALSIIANDGEVIRPHFLSQILDNRGTVLSRYTESAYRLNIPREYFEFVKHGMSLVVSSGTASSISHGLKYTMAAKTGTAQVVSLANGSTHAKFSGNQFKEHAWFIAFAPVEHPKIALAMIVENGGWGAANAPTARKLFDYYLLNESAAITSYPMIVPPKDDALSPK